MHGIMRLFTKACFQNKISRQFLHILTLSPALTALKHIVLSLSMFGIAHLAGAVAVT